MNIKLSFYKYISSLKRPKSYTGKIFLIAFIGTHIPLISVFIYLVFLAPVEGRFSILLTLLIATLVGTAATLYLIYRLLAPILLTNEAVIKYNSDKIVPDLPKEFNDEAGLLMKNTQECITQLDELLKMKNRLIAMVSHDSKTPLGSIKIANSLIKDEIESESPNVDDIQKYIELIEISTTSHSEFLDNMLNLARFDDGKIQLNKVEVAPKELYQRLKDNHEFYLSTKDINFVMRSTLSEPVKLNIDKDKMMSVLNNLIQNAIKFTEESGTIELKVERKDERHLIQITDNGIGISEERKQSIFEAFSSSSRGTKSEIGSGLGLWIVKVFTDLHDGEVYFDTKEGEGTTFTISLPAV